MIVAPPVIGPPVRRPPDPGTREKKLVLNGTFWGMRGVIDALGESIDIIDAAYDALDESVRRKSDRTRLDRVRRIINNVDAIDPVDLILNLIDNEIEDRLWGLTGRLARDANKNLRNPGVLFGPALDGRRPSLNL